MLVDYKLPNTLTVCHKDGPQVILKPGRNQVTASEWKWVSGHPKVKKMMEDKTIVVEDAADPKPEGGLSHLNVAQARDTVNETLDVNELQAWLKVEKRSGVKKLIEKQLKKIEDATKPLNKDNDSGDPDRDPEEIDGPDADDMDDAGDDDDAMAQ